MGVSAVNMAVGAPIAPFFRFPDLQMPAEAIAYLGTRNIATFSTDIDTFDFKIHKPDDVVKSVMTKLGKAGKGIILMHDFQKGDRRGDAGNPAPAQGRRLQGRAHGAEATGDDAGEIRRHGQGAGQVLVQQQHPPESASSRRSTSNRRRESGDEKAANSEPDCSFAARHWSSTAETARPNTAPDRRTASRRSSSRRSAARSPGRASGPSGRDRRPARVRAASARAR